MALVYADLHIHIGRTNNGKPVKITASPKLTLENIVKVAKEQKGLNLIGLVDAATSGVLEDLLDLLHEGKLTPIKGGGYHFADLTLFLGSEVEIVHKSGKEAHFLAFFPDLDSLRAYAKQLSNWVTNPSLSTQRVKTNADQWLKCVIDLQGVPLAAHAFTPHKGVYGNCVHKLAEMFENPSLIQGLELGLSADTNMALKIQDTHSYAYLSNSDAHSLRTIAREFTIYDLPTVNFNGWRQALQTQGRGIVANHGLEPLLGKYYRSFCTRCEFLAKTETATLICPNCGRRMIYGVWDRILEIADFTKAPPFRPPYQSHIPLAMLPGVGPKTYSLLIEKLGTEIEILYTVSLEVIENLVGGKLAKQIANLRGGTLSILPGGGGKYGKVTNSQER